MNPLRSVREATQEDALPIATIQVQTWRCAYKGNVSDEYLDSLSIEKRTERWREILNQPETKTFVGLLDGEVAGFCNAGVCRDEDSPTTNGEIYSMYVDQHSMGKGVGSALMQTAIQYLKSNHYKSATLWVFPWNKKAQAFYEKHGWKLDGKEKFEERPGTTFHEIRYRIDFE